MKSVTSLPILSLFALYAAQLGVSAEEQLRDVGAITLADGVTLSGSPKGITTNSRLKWSVSSLLDPLSIPCSSLLEMQLPHRNEVKQDISSIALVTLSNGDNLPGQLVAVTATDVSLQTQFGGTLNLRRSMVRRIEILDGKALYSGPKSLVNWTVDGDQDAWQLDPGSMRSRKGASIAREFDTPEQCRISFDLSWKHSLRFQAHLFSDDGQTANPDNCYTLTFNRRFVYLRKRWMNVNTGGSKIVGQSNVANLTKNQSARLDLYIDRKAGVFLISFDDIQGVQWTDTTPDIGSFGKWFHLVTEDFYPLTISRIRVFPWDGQVAENVEGPGEPPAGNEVQDAVSLDDRRQFFGRIIGIENGIVHLQSETGEVKLPISQVSTINLRGDRYEEPKRKKGDIRAWTHDGGRITYRLDSLTEGIARGNCQTFGDGEFKLHAFSRIEFNIYDESLETMRRAQANR